MNPQEDDSSAQPVDKYLSKVSRANDSLRVKHQAWELRRHLQVAWNCFTMVGEEFAPAMAAAERLDPEERRRETSRLSEERDRQRASRLVVLARLLQDQGRIDGLANKGDGPNERQVAIEILRKAASGNEAAVAQLLKDCVDDAVLVPPPAGGAVDYWLQFGLHNDLGLNPRPYRGPRRFRGTLSFPVADLPSYIKWLDSEIDLYSGLKLTQRLGSDPLEYSLPIQNATLLADQVGFLDLPPMPRGTTVVGEVLNFLREIRREVLRQDPCMTGADNTSGGSATTPIATETNEQAEPKEKPRMSTEKAREIAEGILTTDPSFRGKNVREWMAAIGCSQGTAHKIWKAIRNEQDQTQGPKRRTRKPKVVHLSPEILATLGECDLATAELIEDQDADFEPSPFEETGLKPRQYPTL